MFTFLIHSIIVVVVLVAKSYLTLFQPRGLQPNRLLCPWDFPGKNIGEGCHFLFQGIFPTPGSNPCLLHWQEDSLPPSHLGSLYLALVALVSVDREIILKANRNWVHAESNTTHYVWTIILHSSKVKDNCRERALAMNQLGILVSAFELTKTVSSFNTSPIHKVKVISLDMCLLHKNIIRISKTISSFACPFSKKDIFLKTKKRVLKSMQNLDLVLQLYCGIE